MLQAEIVKAYEHKIRMEVEKKLMQVRALARLLYAAHARLCCTHAASATPPHVADPGIWLQAAHQVEQQVENQIKHMEDMSSSEVSLRPRICISVPKSNPQKGWAKAVAKLLSSNFSHAHRSLPCPDATAFLGIIAVG